MDDFATYILNEEDHIQKMIIAYYLSKKTKIFFDRTVVLKTEIAKIFIDYAKLNVDKNFTLTAMLLCNCKKMENEKIYATIGAEYLSTLGFSKRFCNICEGVNRNNNLKLREPESDILEIIDSFIETILETKFTINETFIQLKEKKLKDIDNRYINDFEIFLKDMEKINIKENISVPVIKKLIALCNISENTKSFIASLGNEYDKKICDLIEKFTENQIKAELKQGSNSDEDIKDKAIFTKEIADKILNHESVYRIEEDE